MDKFMADKEPQFIVTERRKFTTEGDLREGARHAAYQQSSRLLDKMLQDAQPR